jgi:hypothetical protein
VNNLCHTKGSQRLTGSRFLLSSDCCPTLSSVLLQVSSDVQLTIPTGGLAQMIDAEIDKIDGDERLCNTTAFVPLGPSNGKSQDLEAMNELAKKGFGEPFVHEDLPNLINLDSEAAKRLGPGSHDPVVPSLLNTLNKMDPLQNTPERVCEDARLLLPYFKRMSAALRLQAASSP